MKIMYNYQIFHLKYGGITKYFYELAKNISSYKNVEVKINSFFYKNGYLNNKDKNLNYNGIKFPEFRGSGKLCLMLNSFFSGELFRTYNPDIIHETYYNALSQKSKNIKKIITVHDMTHELLPGEFSFRDKTTKLKKYAVEKADHILCNSYNTRNDLIRIFKTDIKKISVIYHSFSFNKDSKFYKFKKEKKPYLLYVGSRDGYKNFMRFVKAYANPKIKNFYNLIMFGGGDLKKNEIKLFKELEIKENSYKQISGNDMSLSNYYKNASCLFTLLSMKDLVFRRLRLCTMVAQLLVAIQEVYLKY